MKDAFRGQPGLRVENLTFLDIRKYGQDELEDDERMKRQSHIETPEAAKLIYEIVTAANGVFLWVKLVVASLLRGLGNRDQVKDLQARLRILPRKLEDLYRHMILRVDEFYQAEASRLYQLVAASSNTRDGDWIRVPPFTIFALAMAEETDDLALTSRQDFLTHSDILVHSSPFSPRDFGGWHLNLRVTAHSLWSRSDLPLDSVQSPLSGDAD